jgi:alkylhydroperoxidase/carboxymuconolactone decarboxylase family protein YurZ
MSLAIQNKKEGYHMKKQTAGRDALGEFAPKFAELNDDVLFGEICRAKISSHSATGAS